MISGMRAADDSEAAAHWTLADSAGNRMFVCARSDGSAQR
jgi:hypothetical protein